MPAIKFAAIAAAIVILAAAPARAGVPETFFIEQPAWTCQSTGSIEFVERLAAQERGNDQPRFSPELTREADKGGCIPFSTPSPVTPVWSDDKFAFACDHLDWTDFFDRKQRGGFYCQYALISDLRDAHGHSVNAARVAAAAAKTSLWDIAAPRVR